MIVSTRHEHYACQLVLPLKWDPSSSVLALLELPEGRPALSDAVLNALIWITKESKQFASVDFSIFRQFVPPQKKLDNG